MSTEFAAVFEVLKGTLEKNTRGLAVKADTASDYSVTGKVPSPFPQHKGQPMWIAAVQVRKAYVSYHLMPLYMNPPLQAMVSPELKKRMQGKACFNFKKVPDPGLLKELSGVTKAAVKDSKTRGWI
jgi:hypothetical protein